MSPRLFQTLRLGLKSLLLHKLRSGLAVLGILIGVTAVIWLVAMGEGVSHQAQEQIKQLGATNIIIRSIKPPQESSRTGNRSGFVIEYGLLRDDFERIKANIPMVKQAVPLREVKKEVRIAGGDQKFDSQFIGCTPEYQEMNNLAMERGRFITDRDMDRVDNVCVIGNSIANLLFPYESSIDKIIQIDRDVYRVIGQTASRSATGNIGGSLSSHDYNQDVYIPLTTLRARIGDRVISSRPGSFEGESVQLSQITVTVGSVEEVDETEALIQLLLEKYHKNPDYSIIVPKELLRQAEAFRIMFNGFLILIAGIALLVGGIGIMNIMLATVTERTREIGIRRALGAKQRDIVEQFLTETVLLSATGGLLGVVLGFLCKPAVNGLRQVLTLTVPEVVSLLPPEINNLQPRLAPWSVVAAFLISVAVGVLFGLYPARRAAQMDPIEALRHE